MPTAQNDRPAISILMRCDGEFPVQMKASDVLCARRTSFSTHLGAVLDSDESQASPLELGNASVNDVSGEPVESVGGVGLVAHDQCLEGLLVLGADQLSLAVLSLLHLIGAVGTHHRGEGRGQEGDRLGKVSLGEFAGGVRGSLDD